MLEIEINQNHKIKFKSVRLKVHNYNNGLYNFRWEIRNFDVQLGMGILEAKTMMIQ